MNGALLITACLAVPIAQASAAVVLDEPFDYTAPADLGGNGGWAASGSGADVQVTAGSLSYPGQRSPSGNMVSLAGVTAVTDRVGTGTVSSGTLYYSLFLKVTDLTGAATGGSFIGGFNNSDTSATATPTRAAARLQVRADPDPADVGKFNLGVRSDSRSGAVSPIAWESTAFTPGADSDVIFVVAAYQFNSGVDDDVASMWINPDLSTWGTETAPTTTLTSTGSDLSTLQIQSFFLRQNDVAPNQTLIDELRIGTTWAEVTAVPEPSTLAFAGISLLALVRRRR